MSKNKSNHKVKYNYHGSIKTPEDNRAIIEKIIDANIASVALGDRKVCHCTWGTHGIGKTAIPKQIAKDRGWGFVPITPSEFEEMGDFIGMPGTGLWVEKEGEAKAVDSRLVDEYCSNGWIRMERPAISIYSPPGWVPNPDLGDPKEGILLIDDVNRCDKRILNGIMGLLQFGEVISWKLPEGWHILLTANPTGGTYSVNEMDNAQMTRMVHTSMIFDATCWARWASQNNVDDRVINFVMKHEEVVQTGILTTPRSITNFSRCIRNMEDLKSDIGFVLDMAKGSLDETTATTFATFINQGFSTLITPAQILNSKNFKKEVEIDVIDELCKGATKRVDIIAILATRVTFYALDTLEGKLNPGQMDNLREFIKCTNIPNDIRLTMCQDLCRSGKGTLKKLASDPVIARLIIKRM